jgi:hypothetical protein
MAVDMAVDMAVSGAIDVRSRREVYMTVYKAFTRRLQGG